MRNVLRTALVTLALTTTAHAQMGDPSRLPLPVAQLLPVNGHHLAVHCEGNGPTVVLLSGGGVPAVSWVTPPPAEMQPHVMLNPPFGARVPVQAALRDTARVCVYDRPGLGSSDVLPNSTPRTIDHAVADLHALLARVAPDGPVVLVGHSLGGLIAFEYTRTHPDNVAGLVLVDAAHPDERNRTAWYRPQNEAAEARAIQLGHEHLDTRPATSKGRNAVPPGVLGNVPLVVLTVAEGVNAGTSGMYGLRGTPENLARWRATHWTMAAEYAAASALGQLHAVPASGHFIPFDRPDLVVQAVHAVLPRAAR